MPGSKPGALPLGYTPTCVESDKRKVEDYPFSVKAAILLAEMVSVNGLHKNKNGSGKLPLADDDFHAQVFRVQENFGR